MSAAPDARRRSRGFAGTVAVRRVENLALAAGIAALFVAVGYQWWWLAVLFLVPDLSAVGYAVGERVGAASYNIGHSYLGPLLVLGVHAFVSEQPLQRCGALFAALIWAFHVAVDRALGYGLKHTAGFHSTDLGTIGHTVKP